jgi:hypothetical protein
MFAFMWPETKRPASGWVETGRGVGFCSRTLSPGEGVCFQLDVFAGHPIIFEAKNFVIPAKPGMTK